MNKKIKGFTSSNSVEWYSPEKYVNSVRTVFNGTITLDPASSEKANSIIQAQFFYTKENSSLNISWNVAENTKVFMNPPYGRGITDIFVNKMISEYKIGNITEGIILVNNNTAQTWFQPLFSFPICFTNHRIKYINGETMKPDTKPPHGNAFVYLGKNIKKFAEEFRQWGNIVITM